MELEQFEDAVRRSFEHELPRLFGGQFEKRDSQVEMAAAVARTIADGGLAVIEAETGLGKSLAYLIPVLMHCAESGARAVVSTYTRTLQRQLIEQDVARASAVAGTQLIFAVLMGRSNYVCKRAVERLMKRDDNDCERIDLLRAVLADPEGELDRIPAAEELGGAVRASIAAPSWDSVCRGCSLRDGCALFIARRRALEADIVFVNHALLFADVAAGGNLLGEYDVLVTDEAHHLQEVATNYLTFEFTPDALKGTGSSLFSAEHSQLFAYARDMAHRDAPARSREIEALWRKFHDQLDAAHHAVQRCFNLLENAIRDMRNDDSGSVYGTSFVYGEGSPLFYGLDEDVGIVRTALASVGAAVTDMEAMLIEHERQDEGTLAAGMRAFSEVVRELADAFEFLTNADDDGYVFYVRANQRQEPFALTAQPIDVSMQLGALLEERGETQIVTSATLSVDGDFSYVLGLTGIAHSSRVRTYLFETPFDLKRQRTLLLASFMPAPGSQRFTTDVADVISAIARRAPRNLLVLCTSREQVKSIHAVLSRAEDLEPLLLSQIEGSSRSRLTASFKESPGKILLGLASFWEGVDFPGDLLEIVVIVKMPFMVPFEPIVRARSDKLQREGENPFQALFLPDAALKLKQGAGRLIRTGSDRGVVILLDSRLGEKSYGPAALRSIAGDFVRCGSRQHLLAEIDKAFTHES